MFNQVEIMLYVNDPEKCAKFWSEQVGFDMGNAETCNFADPEGHYFAFKSVKA